MISWRAISMLIRHPGLWVEAVRTLFAMSARHWWRRYPFVPIPDGALLRWRAQTAYGVPDRSVVGKDLVSFLAWRKRQRSSRWWS